MNDEFALHEIVVIRAEVDPEASDGQEIEYHVVHGACPMIDDDCLVSSIVRDLGLRSALYGIWGADTRPRIEVKTYVVRAWEQKYDIPGMPVEWDAGIEEVDHGEH
jgi:hypothetical protein